MFAQKRRVLRVLKPGRGKRGKSAARRPRPVPKVVVASPAESASEAGLTYVTGEEPGITRSGGKNRFRYHDAGGKLVRDPVVLARIKSLVIPPNWTNVWICSKAHGHLQATGRDLKNRKQYRYHPRYRAVREETKYEKLILFGNKLPTIRERVEQDLAASGLPRERVVATVVRLMDIAHIRIGNEEYARTNQSFGLTTLRDRHVKVEGSSIHFQFRGKSGKLHSLGVHDRQLAQTVKKCRDLPGYELFQYIGEDGKPTPLDSGMVNDYLRATTGDDLTAKDFRTWHGTVLAAEQLGACGPAKTASEARHNVVEAIRTVAERLGNRVATCRKYYVHPHVIELYNSGELDAYLRPDARAITLKGLAPVEECVLSLLTRRAAKLARSA